MRALVTGICGFTGRYITDLLLSRGLEVVGLSHSQCAIPGVKKVYAADMANESAVDEIVRNTKPHYVIHLAAISFVVHNNIDEIYRTNIVGTRNLLSSLVESKSPVSAVLIASSSNVYGNRTEGILRENSPVDPVNDYSVSKVATELVAGLFRDRLPIVVTRPFNYTGVGQSTNFLIPKIVASVVAREFKIQLGNLDIARDFSDVRFVAEAYSRLLDCSAAIGTTVNVSSGRAYQLSDIIEMVSKIGGYGPHVEVNAALVRSNDVKSLWGESSLLDSLIGPIKRIDLEDTIRWMVSHERSKI